MIIRLQIPESPRYTLDVLLKAETAFKDTEGYYFVPVATPRSQEEQEMASDDNLAQSTQPSSGPEPFRFGMEQTNGDLQSDETPNIHEDADRRHQTVSPVPQSPQIPRRRTQVYYQGTANNLPPARSIRSNKQSGASPFTLRDWWSGFREYMFKEGNWIHLAGTMSSWFLLDVRT